MDIIYQNCNRLDILINKEPPARRNNIKYKVDQLKYDLKHVQNSLAILQQRRCVREREKEEREALLSRNFTTNDDTSIFLDYELHHHDKLGESNRALDELLGAGGSILEGLKHQGSSLKSAHTRVISLAQTLDLATLRGPIEEGVNIHKSSTLITTFLSTFFSIITSPCNYFITITLQVP
ncbi:hypothetical protein Pmani_038888 [Petrolisthes manimaculis]|nr:hypothetical protein Pmani_038888 [Petrolisthes manimaculis]